MKTVTGRLRAAELIPVYALANSVKRHEIFGLQSARLSKAISMLRWCSSAARAPAAEYVPADECELRENADGQHFP
jgi:hypothetical protein